MDGKGSGSGLSDSKVMNSCVPDLVQAAAKTTPQALAVRSDRISLTYSELNDRSNRLANYLLSQGAKQGSVIGLCLERSADFPVAALAILKAGCAYLPLETKSPARRLQTMLKTAQVSVVLTSVSMLDQLAGDSRKLIALDGSTAAINRCSADAPAVAISPEQTAYVIFTSGSTGAPKAVAVGHDSLLNLVQWHNRAFHVTPATRATQVASIGFDAAVWELWPNLVAGASVHLVDEETRTQPDKLRDYLVREKITVSFVPTPLAERMLQLSWPRETSLRFLLTGADALHSYPPANLPFTLVNNYGPTECTVVATSAAIEPLKSGARSESMPPIGRSIDNAEVHILDEKMRPVPAGSVGELYIGGALLAKGYLNDPALTAERFVVNPFRAGARLYRTGDLGCQLADGQIAFRGRADEQVKINGYRIELNEVSSVLRRHPAIRESVLVAADNRAGEKQLVAYIVPASEYPAVSELREFLSNDLPEYMLPATFVGLDSLPLGTNGKVDRAALPVPSDENILREESFLGPRTPTEERVAAIVARLLGLERVGINDNFFYLGGNSLFGTQVIARVRDAFNVEISLLKLFDHPTVADLSAEVERLIVARLDAMTDEEAQRLLDLNAEQARA